MTTFGYGLASSADGRVYDWVFPLGTTYWDQMAAMIAYLGQKEGGLDKLKGKKIAFLYHDSAYGKEPIPVLDALGAKLGFDVLKIPVTPPGQTQESQWLQIRQAKPDYVIVWTYGVMSTVALKTAAKTGYPRDKLLGVWWAGSEEDVDSGRRRRQGLRQRVVHGVGHRLPGDAGHQDQGLRRRARATSRIQTRLGNVMYTRGVVYGMIVVEALRVAQAKYGKGKVMTPEQLRWGFEHLNLTEARIKELGAAGSVPADQDELRRSRRLGHGEVPDVGRQRLQAGHAVHGGRPRDGAQDGRGDSAAKYAAEKKITPRDCGKEG